MPTADTTHAPLARRPQHPPPVVEATVTHVPDSHLHDVEARAAQRDFYRDVAILATSLAALFLLVIAALSVVVVMG